MHRYVVAALLVTVAAAGFAAGVADADTLVGVYVDGSKQSFDPGARVRAGKAYAPLRAAVEAVGASVQWVEAQQIAALQQQLAALEQGAAQEPND